MIFNHHDQRIELPDEWWEAAGMAGFKPTHAAYPTDAKLTDGKQIFDVKILDVRPVQRNPGVGIFNDGEEGTAKERVTSLLRGFRVGSLIRPVEVVQEPAASRYRFKLVAGAHRFYCSLAVGFTHVPAIKGFDWATLDQ
jgi:hypothetical protein